MKKLIICASIVALYSFSQNALADRAGECPFPNQKFGAPFYTLLFQVGSTKLESATIQGNKVICKYDADTLIGSIDEYYFDVKTCHFNDDKNSKVCTNKDILKCTVNCDRPQG